MGAGRRLQASVAAIILTIGVIVAAVSASTFAVTRRCMTTQRELMRREAAAHGSGRSELPVVRRSTSSSASI
jgi:hypothetical protein